ncbi:MAG: hypothetical protein IPN62_17460 [Flavobacteriales bacterium]|nr:hypothetical protein [Flavobacteriales bacterium]
MNSSGVDNFQGELDELAIYNRALSEVTLRQHYLDGSEGLRRGYQGCQSNIKVMPLGDSITRGNAAIPRWSYRPYLFQDLTNSGIDIDFVGGLTDNYNTGFVYDRNHEGHSGWTPAQVAANIMSWLKNSKPEMILLHIGTNELNIADVESILNIIDTYNENIVVVLARIINQVPYNPAVTRFNGNLTTMVNNRSGTGLSWSIRSLR